MQNILVVEDEKAIAKALELKLTHSGFKVKSVQNGKDALDAIEKNKFDLILLDLVIPILDGFGVLTALQVKKLKIPIIVLTNLSQEEDRKRALDLGATDFFVKSETPIAGIVSRVRSLLK
jgi:DNA-binding response OmpR family regulator